MAYRRERSLQDRADKIDKSPFLSTERPVETRSSSYSSRSYVKTDDDVHQTKDNFVTRFERAQRYDDVSSRSPMSHSLRPRSGQSSQEEPDTLGGPYSAIQRYGSRPDGLRPHSTRERGRSAGYHSPTNIPDLKKTRAKIPQVSSSLLVAAIDFGTTFSGSAFSFKHDFEKDPTKVSAKNWIGQQISQKGPTCVLIEPDGKTLHSFGYEAETKYIELAQEQAHKKWYFFKRFKMMLFDRIGIERNIQLEDINRRKLPAMTVFSLSIKYMKDELIKTTGKTLLHGGLRDEDIHWVLTVPAIWNDAAKQFMREAAENAGIPKHKLTISLEPEAASLFCRYLPVEKIEGSDKVSLGLFKAGTKYLVVDAGGGTVDTTVHEIINEKEIREIYRASGGAWGGTKVDKAFESFLGKLVGQTVLSKFKDEHMEDYLELFRDFEIKKRVRSSSEDSKITIRILLALITLIGEMNKQSMNDCIQTSTYRKWLTVTGDKLRMDAKLMRSFFAKPVKSICQHVEELLSKPVVSDCSAIVLVGGFSESPFLQKSIQNQFGKLKVIVPDEAGLAVLKGAVIFGHAPLAITERVCKYTYGLSTKHTYTRNCKHLPGRRTTDKDGVVRCKDIFTIHAKLGQAIQIGEETSEHLCGVIYDQKSMLYEIFASTAPNPQLVTEPSCRKIGSFVLSIPDTTLGKKRKFGVTFRFGGTEIEVKVIDKATGKITTQSVNFLG